MVTAAKEYGQSPLARLATSRLDKLRAAKVQDHANESLMDFVVRINPKFERPEHLQAIIPYLEAVETDSVQVCLSAPPRHGKSELVWHMIARYMARHPTHNVAYCAFSATFAERKSVNIKEICRRAGVEFSSSSKAKDTWQTSQGGTFFARGPGGPLTGEGVHLLVCDDPYRSRAEAESSVIRENVWDWWTSVAMTRIEPCPDTGIMGSTIVTHTRWHEEDIIGRLRNELNWPYINLPAISEDGDALWPKFWSLENLEKRRAIVQEYNWASMYMGEPRPRGGALFGDPTLYTPSPDTVYKKHVIGIDLAYSAKTHADHSVAVVLGITLDNHAHVIEVRRKQCEAPVFCNVLKELRARYNNAQICWFTGPTEKGTADLFKTLGVPVKTMPAKGDKFVRAQESAAAWNAGKIQVPQASNNWETEFLGELLSFTGLGDLHDDQVDALAAAYFLVATPPKARGMGQKRLLPF